ncbi:OmpH family outer membrane protein [Pseudooceanicola sp.]|uniref:OmpH family outer membrane protein n=1 Tax=Pseudooceanicola sp. TaxID=1914328 RepID=UPI004059C5A0
MARAARRIAAALCAALALVGPARAQQLGGEVVQSPVLLIDSEEAFARSALGQRIAQEIESVSKALAAENRTIEAELIEEERRLTALRETLPAEEFRKRADAFDEKVRRIRSEQDAKARALNQRGDAGRREFLTAARPVLEEIMRDSGAAVILETRDVFLGADAVNVTGLVIDRLDAVTPPEEASPEPDPAPSDEPAEAPAPDAAAD